MDGERYFSKEMTSYLKGVAIILMFALHLLKPEWMLRPDLISDITIGSSKLSAILARSGDICIGIFAFITGYGWVVTFEKKTKIKRIFGLGGGYWSYWVILIFFSFPIRVFMEGILEGKLPWPSYLEIVKSFLAISSESIKFGWYIYFFALCIVSYRFLMDLTEKIPAKGFLKIMIVCLVALALRYVSRILFTRVVDFPDALGVFSHYFQWIPVIISGSIVHKESLFEKWNHILEQKKINKNVFCIALCLGLYVGKSFFQFYTDIYSNFDSFFIYPFIFGLIGALKCIIRFSRIQRVLQMLGELSMYLWLTHSILLYNPMQILLCNLRVPIVILLVSFVIMVPISVMIQAFDKKILQEQIKKFM